MAADTPAPLTNPPPPRHGRLYWLRLEVLGDPITLLGSCLTRSWDGGSIVRMRDPSLLERPTLTTGIALLLFAPLLVGAHGHEVHHDGATQHIEVPHGGHVADVAEAGDRIPSTGLTLSVELATGSAATVDSGVTDRPECVVSEDIHHPARAPPGSHRSRAPPLLS